jgi:hypothetical protein
MTNSIDFIINIQDQATAKVEGLSKQVEGLQGKFDGAAEHAKKFGEIAEKVGEKVKEAFIEVFLIEKAIELVKDAITGAFEETVKLNMAQEGLRMAVENTNAKNAMSLEMLKGQTEELRKHSDFEKTAIVQAEARIALVGLSAEQQKKANQVAVDYAAQQTLMGRETSPEAAAEKLQRALVNVKGATKLLADEGVTLTTSQKKQLQGFVDTGQKAEAQGIILDALASKTEGAAERMLKADPMGRLKLGMEEISEKLGPMLIKAFDRISPIIEKVVNGIVKLIDFIGENSEAVGDLADTWEEYFTPIIEVAEEIIDDVKHALQGMFDWIKNNSKELKEFGRAAGTVVAEVLVVMWEVIEHIAFALAGVWHLIVAVADALLGNFSAAWDEAGKAADDFWTKQGDAYDKAADRIQKLEDKKNAKNGIHGAGGSWDDETKPKKTGGGPKGIDQLLGGGASGASSGSKGPTVINIHIDKFGELHIETKNISEAPKKVHSALLSALTEALNDSENIATRPS